MSALAPSSTAAAECPPGTADLIAAALADHLTVPQRVTALTLAYEVARRDRELGPRALERLVTYGEGWQALAAAYGDARAPLGSLRHALGAASAGVRDFGRELVLFAELRSSNEGGRPLTADILALARAVAAAPQRLGDPLAAQLVCLAHRNVTADDAGSLQPLLASLPKAAVPLPALMVRRLLNTVLYNETEHAAPFLAKLDQVLKAGWSIEVTPDVLFATTGANTAPLESVRMAQRRQEQAERPCALLDRLVIELQERGARPTAAAMAKPR